MKIYSVKNEKLGFFNRPIYCESEAEALSMIQNILMSDADRALSNLKGDLALYKLGIIDFETGVINPCIGDFESLDMVTTDNFYAPVYVCSLEEIFDTIPEEMLKPKLTVEDFRKVCDKIKSLEGEISALSDSLKCHKHYRKEIIK